MTERGQLPSFRGTNSDYRSNFRSLCYSQFAPSTRATLVGQRFGSRLFGHKYTFWQFNCSTLILLLAIIDTFSYIVRSNTLTYSGHSLTNTE